MAKKDLKLSYHKLKVKQDDLWVEGNESWGYEEGNGLSIYVKEKDGGTYSVLISLAWIRAYLRRLDRKSYSRGKR